MVQVIPGPHSSSPNDATYVASLGDATTIIMTLPFIWPVQYNH